MRVSPKRIETLSALVASNLGANLIMYGGLYAMGRLVGPKEFGIYAAISALGMALYPLMTLRYEQAIPLAHSSREARAILSLSLALCLATSFVLFSLFTAGGWLPENWLPAAATDTGSAWLLVLFAFSAAVFGISQSLALRKNALNRLALFRVVRAVVLVSLQLALVLGLGRNFASMLGADIVANLAISAMLMLSLSAGLRMPRVKYWKLLRRRIVVVSQKYKSFPIINLPHALVHGALTAAYATSLGVLYGAATLGNYYMMQRVVFSAIGLLSTALYQQGLSESARRPLSEVRRVVHGIVLLLLAVGAFAAGGLLLFGAQIFEMVLGEQWQMAGTFAAASAARIIMEPIASALAFVPMIVSKQRQAFAWAIVQGATALGVLALSRHFGASAIEAVTYSSFAMAAVMVAYTTWIVRSLRGRDL